MFLHPSKLVFCGHNSYNHLSCDETSLRLDIVFALFCLFTNGTGQLFSVLILTKLNTKHCALLCPTHAQSNLKNFRSGQAVTNPTTRSKSNSSIVLPLSRHSLRL